MKHIVEFTLPEDKEALTMLTEGPKYYNALIELASWIREKVKYSQIDIVNTEELREKFFEVINENEINLNL